MNHSSKLAHPLSFNHIGMTVPDIERAAGVALRHEGQCTAQAGFASQGLQGLLAFGEF